MRVGLKPLKRLKKGLLGPFGGPYGGIPKVLGGGPIGPKRGLKRKRRNKGVERTDKGLL